MQIEIEDLLDAYLKKYGEAALRNALLASESPDDNSTTLTIIANSGVHPAGASHARGEVYIASTGNLDFSSRETAENEFRKILLATSKKLKSKPWTKIYLVPFGPSVLSMLIKLLVYRVLSLETIDVLHIGNGKHVDIHIDTRLTAIGNKQNI